VGNVAIFAARRPHDEQGNAIEQTDALQASFAIGVACIFAREQVAKKETVKVGKINPVIGQIPCTFGFVPCVYGS